mgnify:CR=1 FL=1|tara:strand:+ start:1248 stop:1427 length:180 start_codon:yes stop_codon:yes gene_type:complete
MDWFAIYGKDLKKEYDEEELSFDYEDMDISELDSIDGKNGWGSGSLEQIPTEISSDWYE